ncbi:GAF domain-containing protein [Nocardia yamanashiensis]|uniref:GAF domain-containing protein n=1 Tax=Nocardia yamanashiensis TaxID=209247 RepID=UPI0008351F19|nr:GAF domain-containing protein [Nocardia yamanashiensis]
MEPVTAPRSDDPGDDRTAQTSATWPWVVIETLTEPDDFTVVLDGPAPRAFSRLNRASISRNSTAARMLPGLVRDAAATGRTRDQYFHLSDDRVRRMMVIPVAGPTGIVHATAVWVGGIEEPLPRLPIIGAIEWTIQGLAVANPAGQFLLRAPQGDLLSAHTLPEMLSGFDEFEDRPGFLSLFNLGDLDTPAQQWHGTARLRYDDGGELHTLFLAARAVGQGTDRVVRAVVTDITGSQTPTRPDLTLAAVRHMPITPGHALALADLKTGFIHEWLTSSPTSPLTAWRHHNPEFDPVSKLEVVQACYALATGTTETVTHQVTMRFSEADDWIPLLAKWTLISGGDRPQALIDITPMAPLPSPAVSGCRMCADFAARNATT